MIGKLDSDTQGSWVLLRQTPHHTIDIAISISVYHMVRLRDDSGSFILFTHSLDCHQTLDRMQSNK